MAQGADQNRDAHGVSHTVMAPDPDQLIPTRSIPQESGRSKGKRERETGGQRESRGDAERVSVRDAADVFQMRCRRVSRLWTDVRGE